MSPVTYAWSSFTWFVEGLDLALSGDKSAQADRQRGRQADRHTSTNRQVSNVSCELPAQLESTVRTESAEFLVKTCGDLLDGIMLVLNGAI